MPKHFMIIRSDNKNNKTNITTKKPDVYPTARVGSHKVSADELIAQQPSTSTGGMKEEGGDNKAIQSRLVADVVEVKQKFVFNPEIYECACCRLTYETAASLAGHICTVCDVARTFDCDICGRSFKSNANLYSHKRWSSH